MNNFVSLGLIYSSSYTNVAFAVVENSGNKINVMAINEIAGHNVLTKMENLISSIFQNYLNTFIVMSFIKIDSIQFEEVDNDSIKNKIENAASSNLLKNINCNYSYADLLNKNEIQALKLAIGNINKFKQ